MSARKTARPFLARLASTSTGAVEYLHHDGAGHFGVITFANDEHAQEFADAKGEIPFLPWSEIEKVVDALDAQSEVAR